MKKIFFLILLFMTPFLNAHESKFKIEKYRDFSNLLIKEEMSDEGFKRIKKMEKEKKMFDIFHNVVIIISILSLGITWIFFVKMMAANKLMNSKK